MNDSCISKFKFRPNSDNFHMAEGAINEFTNIIQNRSQRQILILCTDLLDKRNSKHVVDAAVALTEAGHKITVVTTAFDPDMLTENFSHINVVKTGSWIPTSLFGALPEFFYLLRSLYSTIYMIQSFKKLQPKVSLVLCETNTLMIPLIKLTTNYKIVVFRYEFNLNKRSAQRQTAIYKSWIINQSLRNADEVLIPNKSFFYTYKKMFSYANISPTVCEPFLNVQRLKKEKTIAISSFIDGYDDDSLMFLVLAEYQASSNLELSLDAFHLLLHTVDAEIASRLRLVIAGHNGRRQGYLRRLVARIHHLDLCSHIVLRPRPTRLHKKALMAACTAVLFCAEEALWDRYLLEAMSLARPIVAVENGFTSEELEHGITGYVMPANAKDFCAAMSELLFDPKKCSYIGNMAHCVFLMKYTRKAFSDRLDNIIHKVHGDAKQQHVSNNDDAKQLEINELFFG